MNGAPPPLVEASDIGIQLNGRQVLERVDLTVRPREIVTLIGPNGAGKTTLVESFSACCNPTQAASDGRRGCASVTCRSGLPCPITCR